MRFELECTGGVLNHFICQIGSGMGLTASGEISDAAFYELAERELVTPAEMRQAGIISYNRFKDDILILVNSLDRELWKSWLKRLFRARVAISSSAYRSTQRCNTST